MRHYTVGPLASPQHSSRLSAPNRRRVVIHRRRQQQQRRQQQRRQQQRRQQQRRRQRRQQAPPVPGRGVSPRCGWHGSAASARSSLQAGATPLGSIGLRAVGGGGASKHRPQHRARGQQSPQPPSQPSVPCVFTSTCGAPGCPTPRSSSAASVMHCGVGGSAVHGKQAG